MQTREAGTAAVVRGQRWGPALRERRPRELGLQWTSSRDLTAIISAVSPSLLDAKPQRASRLLR